MFVSSPERWFSAHKKTFPLSMINNRVELAMTDIPSSWDKAPGRRTRSQFPVKNEWLKCGAMLWKCLWNSALSIPSWKKTNCCSAILPTFSSGEYAWLHLKSVLSLIRTLESSSKSKKSRGKPSPLNLIVLDCLIGQCSTITILWIEFLCDLDWFCGPLL